MDWTACVLRLYQPEFDRRVSTRGKDPSIATRRVHSHVPINATSHAWMKRRVDFGKAHSPSSRGDRTPGDFGGAPVSSFLSASNHQVSKPLLPGSNPNGEGQSDIAASSPSAASSPPSASGPTVNSASRTRRSFTLVAAPEDEDGGWGPFPEAVWATSWAVLQLSKRALPILVSEFGWYTIPAVSIGAFIYLGFVAAGKEIEQPFTSYFAQATTRTTRRPRHVLPVIMPFCKEQIKCFKATNISNNCGQGDDSYDTSQPDDSYNLQYDS
ncbi:hypothetical protein DFH08DRAFT_819640 [Mycena albidolilacea]|uniref:Uncharacterized protein n=1 Tax=Mycena albidolilacea TaxID=1033008 RepID=A0AAD6ZE13_9AGAR|nr:hypothetical protein DFH08DRAFT_819640 [Mycena albidolilacea]